MAPVKTITRILIWSTVALSVFAFCFLYFFGNINKLKSAVEENLKAQLNCTVKLGDLDWDWDGLKLGVTTSDISLFDKENNLVLQGGQTRFVWHLKNIITGAYSHFYSIESTALYLNAIHYKNGIWNLVAIFPPGPPPKVDNLRLSNSIIYLVDELNLAKKTILYKDLNVVWEKPLFSKLRKINLVTRIGSLTNSSFFEIKGKYAERKKWNWKDSEFNIFLSGHKLDLNNWQSYLVGLFKEAEIKNLDGEFSGFIRLEKKKNHELIKIRSKTITNNFLIELQNKGNAQLIEIPKTNLILRAQIDKKKINIKTLKSDIDELSYELIGNIINWSKPLPEADLELKTNKFNFKSVKPYLPLSLLPESTRARIEPINDEGLVELDLKLKGPLIAPKYYGTLSLDNFNLTAESGFLDVIQGLNGRLVLDGDILKIENLTIPIEGSPLILKGEIDNENIKTSFNLSGKDINVHILQDLITQSGLESPLLNEITTQGRLDLDFDVLSVKNSTPEIKGKLKFHDVGILVFKDEPLEIKNVLGELSLDGSKVIFNQLNGLINNESFSINGDFSLKEDEAINLSANAKHLKVISYILSFISSKTPFKPIAKTISGEISDLDLKATGTFSKPVLDGMLLINNVSFSLPNLAEKINNISGNLRFEGTELVIEDLNGMIQNTDFGVAGYIQDLFTEPKPKLRLVTGDIELSTFWNYLKEELKTTSLSTQANELEKLSGIASVDIFLHPDVVLGNIYFKDGQIKYKSLPFPLNSLSGRLVIGEKNLSFFGLMGNINGSNNFNSDFTISNYLDPSFTIQGQLVVDVEPTSLLKELNPALSNIVISDGLIPTIVDFNIALPWVNLSVYSNLNEGLKLEVKPYIKKPVNKGYAISGNIDFNSKDLDLYLNQFSIRANKLSLSANGSIKNITSQNPELMLYFTSDEPCGLYMIIQPIIPLMEYKAWGMIELSGSVTGTPSMYAVSSNAMLSDLELPELFDKKLTASDAAFSVYFDGEEGTVNSKINNVKYVSFNAKSVSLSANYKNPVINLNEFSLDGNPGSIFAVGSYDPRNGGVSLTANASDLELANLGAFVFLDPSKISGKTSFSLMVDGKGKTKDEIIANTKGDLSFSVSDGKLGQVALLQKGLQIANLFSQGIFGFNLKNIFSLFFKYKDGSFNVIRGVLGLDKGIVKAKEFNYRAKDLFLNSFGFVDLNNSFVGLSFYGYLPERTSKAEQKTPSTSVISILPDAFGKRRFFIPFLSSNPPQYFKFEVKGDIKKPKRIMGHARRSFKWLKRGQLKKEYKFVPRVEN